MGKLIGIIFIIFAVLDDATKEKMKSFFMKIFGNKSDQTPSFPDLQKTVGGKMSGSPNQNASQSKSANGSGSTPSYTYSYSGNGSGSGSTVSQNKAYNRQEQYARPVMRHRGGKLKTIAAYGLFGVSAITFWYLLVSIFENIASSTALIEYASLIPNLIFSIVCLLAGIWLLYTKKRKYDRENRYIAIINQGYGMIPIDNICSQFPVKYDTCVQELQEMINSGVLPGAYIDYGRRLLVIDPKNSSIEPLIKKDDSAAEGTGKTASKSGKKKISEQKIDFLSLERLSKQVKDEDIKLKLIRISTTLKTIGQKVKDDPEIRKDPDVDTFMDMYIPKTIKLVEDYEEVNSMADMPQNKELKENILETLDAIDDAATTLWKDIIHSDMIDLSSELDALQTKLVMDGYKKADLEPGSMPSEFTFDGMDISEDQPAAGEHARNRKAAAAEQAVEHASVVTEQPDISPEDAEKSARQAQEQDAAMEVDLFSKLRAEQEKEKELLK